jgi:hypothetical protein
MLFLRSMSVGATPLSDESKPLPLRRSASCGGAEDTSAATHRAVVGGSVGAEGGVPCSGAAKRVRSVRDDAVLRLEGFLDCYVRTGGAAEMDVEGHAPSLQV